MTERERQRRRPGDVVALRYITTDARIEICWPCRVVEDSNELLALFIAAGSAYKAGPKRTAQAKRTELRLDTPPDEYVWRNDTLRLMLPGQRHSVSLSWGRDGHRRLLKYFVNLEEPYRRTNVGFDTQDHTLDVEITPDLAWRWRDEAELDNHVAEGFYTAALAVAVRAEGQRVIDAILASRARMHTVEGLAAGSGMAGGDIHQRLGYDTTYRMGSAALGVRRRLLSARRARSRSVTANSA